MRVTITARLTTAPAAISEAAECPRERVEDRSQLETDEAEQQGVQQEGQDLPDGIALQARLHGRQLGRVPAHVDAHGDDGEHGRDAGRLRRQVGEVARQQRDRDRGRRVRDAATHLADHEAHADTDGDAADDVEAEAPDGVREREAAGRDRRDGERVDTRAPSRR